MTNSKKSLELSKLGETIRKKSFNSTNEKLICHPEALPAFTAWNAIKKHTLKQSDIPDSIKELHLRVARKIAIITEDAPAQSDKKARKTSYFLNSFATVQRAMQLEIIQLPVDSVSNIDPEGISQHAWFEVANLMFEQLDHRYGWVSYRDIINQNMPQHLIQIFFGTDRITVEMLLQWSGMDMRTYERVRACYRKDHPQVNEE